MTTKKPKQKKSIAREILEIVAIIIAAFVLYKLMSIGLNTQSPMVSVLSESMEPTLHVGDMIIIQQSNDYKIGDIVVYMYGSKPIIHRIIDINKDNMYIIKGDNNPIPDPYPVRKTQIVGKAIAAIPIAGFPRMALYQLGV
jgi:signal peptidase